MAYLPGRKPESRLASVLKIFAAGILTYGPRLVGALDVQYCSNLNTGSDSDRVTNIWQSNGACFNTCLESYAFAVVQGNGCWCSNYVPADTTSGDNCNQDCPGFPDDKCGSSSDGLYGYIALSKSPSGTKGAASSQAVSTESSTESHILSSSAVPFAASSPFESSIVVAPASQAPTPSPSTVTVVTTFVQPVTLKHSITVTRPEPVSPLVRPSTGHLTRSSTPPAARPFDLTSSPVQTIPSTPSSVTVFRTVTDSPRVSIVTSTAATSSDPSTITTSFPPKTTASSSDSTTSSMTWTPTPVTSLMTVTGELRTVTITPTEPPKSSLSVKEKKGGFWSNAGKVAGLFVGLAVIILLSAAAFIYWCWRRHQRQLGAAALASSNDGTGSPRPRSRSMSELGLISDEKGVAGDRNLSRLSSGTATNWGIASTAPAESQSSGDRRNSNARIVDQRLDPGTLWNPMHENSSRVSVRSLQDDRDYSRRVLRLANPDH